MGNDKILPGPAGFDAESSKSSTVAGNVSPYD